MPASLLSAELLPALSLMIPVVGMAMRSKKKNAGNDEVSSPAYQMLIDAYFDGVLTLNTEGIITWSDEHFVDLMGCGKDAFEGKPFTALIDPGDTEKVQQYLIQAVSQPQNFEVHAIDDCGSVLILELSMAAPSNDEEDVIFVGVQDISEEDALRKRIAFTEKMDLLSRVMGSINTDLEMILEALIPLGDMGSDPKIHETLRRLSELERRIELFPRRGIRNGADIAIGELLQSAVDSLGAESPEKAGEIELEIAEDLFPVFGDRDQLVEAIRNALRNANQAAGETGGGVTVNCRSLAVDRATPRRGFLLPPGEYIHLDISDKGPGMPREILDHAFEPLFSTRLGTPLAGLGLAVTYTVIKNHRGYIEIDSAPGQGTTVEIFIPRSRIRQQIEQTSTAPEIPDEEAVVELPSEAVEEIEAIVEEDPVAEAETSAPAIDTAEVTAPAPSEVEVPEAEPDTEPESEATPEKPAEAVEPPEDMPDVPESVEDEADFPAGMYTVSVIPPAADMPDGPESVEDEAEVPSGPEAVAVISPTPEEPEEQEVVEEEVLSDAEIAALSGHETVLIIEENNDSRDLIQESLASFGYSALPARNWVEGLDLFKKHGHLVDLVLLDVLGAEMVWVKTLMDLRRAVPESRVGLMGGDEATETMNRYLEMPGISYLIKPLTVAVLMRGVRQAIDSPKEK